MAIEERRDPGNSGDEVASELRMRSLADHHQQRDPMTDDGFELVWFVADACRG